MAPVTPELAVRRRESPRRGVRLAACAGGLVVLVAAGWWVATHPAALPTSQRTVSASVPAGQAVYLGVFDPPAGFDRTLHVAGVRVFADATTEATIVPMLCRGGSVSVTTTPESFCEEVVPTEGATLGPGDAILLEVTAASAGAIDVDRIRIAYRDGVQWGTQDAGSPARVEALAR